MSGKKNRFKARWNRRRIRASLWAIAPNCHWCGRATMLEAKPHDLRRAVLDRLYERRPIDPVVISCTKCVNDRNTARNPKGTRKAATDDKQDSGEDESANLTNQLPRGAVTAFVA